MGLACIRILVMGPFHDLGLDDQVVDSLVFKIKKCGLCKNIGLHITLVTEISLMYQFFYQFERDLIYIILVTSNHTPVKLT